MRAGIILLALAVCFCAWLPSTDATCSDDCTGIFAICTAQSSLLSNCTTACNTSDSFAQCAAYLLTTVQSNASACATTFSGSGNPCSGMPSSTGMSQEDEEEEDDPLQKYKDLFDSVYNAFGDNATYIWWTLVGIVGFLVLWGIFGCLSCFFKWTPVPFYCCCGKDRTCCKRDGKGSYSRVLDKDDTPAEDTNKGKQAVTSKDVQNINKQTKSLQSYGV